MMRESFARAELRESALERAHRRELEIHLAARIAAGETTNVYARRTRLLIYAALAAGFAFAGFLMSAAPDRLTNVFGWIALAIAIAALLGCARAWQMRHVPVAVFDRSGVRFRGPFVEEFLPWDRLEGAFIQSHQRRFHIALVPKELDAFLAERPPWRRRWMLSNYGTIGSPYALPASSELPAHELFAVLRAYAAAYGEIGPGETPAEPSSPA